MHNYELVFIVRPDLDENAFREVINRVQSWITEAGGAVSKIDVWGKRKLAYTIRKQREGLYVLMNTEMLPTFTGTLERNLRFLEPVMRFLITTVE